MTDICGDNRFEVIAKYKKQLIEGTNIESCPEEMAVIDSILFRFWQMGWLDAIDTVKLQSKIIHLGCQTLAGYSFEEPCNTLSYIKIKGERQECDRHCRNGTPDVDCWKHYLSLMAMGDSDE